MTRLCCPRAGQNKPCNIGLSIWSHVTPVASLRLPACARHHGFQTAAMQAEAIHQYLGKGDHTHARNQVSAHPLPRAHAESSARGEGDPLRKRGGGGQGFDGTRRAAVFLFQKQMAEGSSNLEACQGQLARREWRWIVLKAHRAAK